MKVESICKTLLQVLAGGPVDPDSLALEKTRLYLMGPELSRRIVTTVMASLPLPEIFDAAARNQIELECIAEFQNHWFCEIEKACSAVAQMNTQRPS